VHRRPWIELRVAVDIDGIDERHAFEQAAYLPVVTADAVGALLAELRLRHLPQPVAGPTRYALPNIPRRVVDGMTVPQGGTRP
jgi:hypothetical protein